MYFNYLAIKIINKEYKEEVFKERVHLKSKFYPKNGFEYY